MTEQRYRLIQGDCIEKLREIPDNSIDAIVTDPPYGLEFMGKDWDAPWKAGQPSREFNDIEKGTLGGFTALPNHNRVNNLKCENCNKWKFSSNPCKCENPNFPPAKLMAMQGFQDWCEQWAKECLRVLKPGGHLLSFGGSRTYHRMACAIEDAGFEVRDQMMWVYGSGFPKSHNIAKALDKEAGVEPEVVGRNPNSREDSKKEDNLYDAGTVGKTAYLTKPTSDLAKKWDGWGTALKPSHEPIVVARKPMDGTVAQNIIKWGIGGLNIDGCRVPADGENFDNVKGRQITKLNKQRTDGETNDEQKARAEDSPEQQAALAKLKELGRWPANLVHDGSQQVLDLFPNVKTGSIKPYVSQGITGYDGGWGRVRDFVQQASDGSAARFFYCAKASKADRNDGCEHLEAKPFQTSQPYGEGAEARADGNSAGNPNNHPTVKPTELMRYLVRLVTPVGGTVLDPFNGSGSTGRAAMLEGCNYIGIEMDPEYVKIAEARIQSALKKSQ